MRIWCSVLFLATACDGGSSPRRDAEPIATLPATASELVMADGTLYVTADGMLFAVPVAGGEPTMLTTTPTFGGQLHVTADAFFGGFSDLQRLPRAGGATETLVADADLNGLAVDGERLLWTTRDGVNAGTILTRPLTGDASIAPTVFYTGEPLAEGGPLYVDDTHVYVARNETFDTTIIAVTKDGASASRLTTEDISGLGGVVDITGDDTSLYLVTSTGGGITSTTVKSLPKAGGAEPGFFGDTDAPDDPFCRSHSGLAVDADRVYVACRTPRVRRSVTRAGPPRPRASSRLSISPTRTTRTARPRSSRRPSSTTITRISRAAAPSTARRPTDRPQQFSDAPSTFSRRRLTGRCGRGKRSSFPREHMTFESERHLMRGGAAW